MHEYNIRVYYEDTDAGGVVYYANYLKFAERARTEMMRSAGFEHARILKKQNIAFAVRHLEVDYQRPAKLDDLLIVYTKLLKIGGASMDIEQNINKNGQTIAHLKLTLVCMNIHTNKAARLPKECREIFSKMV